MTVEEAIKHLNKLRSHATKKSELKVYDNFTQTLTKLSNRDFSTENLISIETKLSDLKLRSNPDNRRRYYKKALQKLKEYLKAEFSLVSKGYYTAIGMSIGMCFGVAFGSAIQNVMGISFGLVLGMLIGLGIGRVMDIKAEKEGNVL